MIAVRNFSDNWLAHRAELRARWLAEHRPASGNAIRHCNFSPRLNPRSGATVTLTISGFYIIGRTVE